MKPKIPPKPERLRSALALAALCVLALFSPNAAQAQSGAKLCDEVYVKVAPNIFQVVVQKPPEGNTEYLYPPAFEFVDPAIRDDAYLIVGTAFYMEDGLFYSSAQVFKLLENTLYKGFALRGADGKIHKIECVSALSTNRDCIALKLLGFVPPKGCNGLKAAASSAQNGPAWAAAYEAGYGLMVRGGSVSGRTAEKTNGEWRWLRFSEAAKPNTFGGPLLNNAGEVLGIVTNQAENERQGFALPFEETRAMEENLGEVVKRFSYDLPNMAGKSFEYKFLREVKLPQKLETLQQNLRGEFTLFRKKIVSSLRPHFTASGESGYLQAAGSADILSSGSVPAFPLVLSFSAAKKWQFMQPEKLFEERGFNGESIVFGSMMDYTLALIGKGEGRSFDSLMTDSKWYADYLVLVLNMGRRVAGEDVPIVSFGEPSMTGMFRDGQKRQWYVSLWDLPFADSQALVYALPVPEGVFVMFKIATTDEVSGKAFFDMQFLADCVYPRYMAGIPAWRDYLTFLRKTKMLYPPFDSISINSGAKGCSFACKSFSFEIPAALIPAEEATLRIALGFSTSGGGFSVDVRSVELYTDRKSDGYRYVYFAEDGKPEAGANRTLFDLWEQKRKKLAPYNAQPYNHENFTFYDEVFTRGNTDAATADTLYVFSCEIAGKNRAADMKAFVEAIKPSFRILKK